MHFLLFYKKAPGYAELQAPHTDAHLAYLQTLVAGGHLILGGNLENPADGSALLLFQAGSSAAIESFAQGDPYVQNAIVAQYSVRKWDTVIGSELR